MWNKIFRKSVAESFRAVLHHYADPSARPSGSVVHTRATAAAAADNDDDDASWSRDNWPPITAQYEH